MNLRWHAVAFILGLSTPPLQALPILDTVVVRGATVNVRQISIVMKDGIVDRDALPRRTVLTRRWRLRDREWRRARDF